MLLIPSDQLRHRFRTILASAKTTRSLSATQEAHSHVDFQAIGLEAFVIFAIGPFRSPAFPSQWTPDPAPYRSSGFHTYLTANSEWTTDAQLPCPRRRRGKPNRWFLSGLSSLPWALVGAVGRQYARDQYVELFTLFAQGEVRFCL